MHILPTAHRSIDVELIGFLNDRIYKDSKIKFHNLNYHLSTMPTDFYILNVPYHIIVILYMHIQFSYCNKRMFYFVQKGVRGF